jgi:hypothetical protein
MTVYLIYSSPTKHTISLEQTPRNEKTLSDSLPQPIEKIKNQRSLLESPKNTSKDLKNDFKFSKTEPNKENTLSRKIEQYSTELFRKTFTEEHILAAQTLASFHFQ